MDGISVHGDIIEIEADSTHVLVAHNSFLGGPLEGGNAGILDFVQVLDSLGNIDEDVGASGFGAETPDLSGVGGVPSVFFGEDASAGLRIILGAYGSGLDGYLQLGTHGYGLHVETVVLVWGFGKTHDFRLFDDSLTERHDGVGGPEGDTSVVLLEILQANFEMELTGTSDDVLTGLLRIALNAGVGLGQTLETLNQFGQICCVLGFDGNTHDGGHGELHHANVVCGLACGDGSGLDEVLVNTYQTTNVSAWAVLNLLCLTPHHENGTLDVLNVQIFLQKGVRARRNKFEDEE
jgi:hypothetical protein